MENSGQRKKKKKARGDVKKRLIWQIIGEGYSHRRRQIESEVEAKTEGWIKVGIRRKLLAERPVLNLRGQYLCNIIVHRNSKGIRNSHRFQLFAERRTAVRYKRGPDAE